MGSETEGKADVPRPLLLARGIDSLYVSHNLDTATSRLDWDELAYRKERARNDRAQLTELELGSETFALMPYGKKPYTYVLANRAFELRLAERMQPSCHVQLYSEALWSEGLDALETRFDTLCQSLELTRIRPEVVARADWAFDYHVPAVDFDADAFVSRATKDATHREHGKGQTFRFGQGDTVVRLYDKVAEIEQQSEKAWFFQLWGRDDQVWRIEFQVRGERLRSAGIRTLDDLRALQHDLLRELATNHTTLRTPGSDINRSRWPLHPLWQQLQADIASMPQHGLVRSIDPEQALRWRLERQLRSLYGSLKGLAAINGLLKNEAHPIGLEQLLEALPRLLDTHHGPSHWDAEVQKRLTAHRLGQW